jgi:pimeloyl-ACP methyl ester carboxylesterase
LPLTLLQHHLIEGKSRIMQSRFITVQNIKIHLNETGSGQPVLFIHGNPDSGEMWSSIIERLPQGFHYLAPDLPGFGQSEAASHFDWSIKNRGQWVADLLDAAGITEPVALVGHDHGGPFVASFAVQYPDRVRQIVLQNTLFQADYDWHLFGKLWRLPLVGEYMAFWQRYRITLPLLIWYVRRGAPGLNNAYIAQLPQLQKTWTARMMQAMLAVYRASDPQDFAGWEEKLGVLLGRKPSLVLWGEHDAYLPIRFAEQWEKNGAKLIRFPDGGHWLAVEKPAEYAQHLAEFFQQVPLAVE